MLMQGAFNVWCAGKKETIRGLRFKPMQRHVFLYEKKIVLCKKKDDSSHAGRASYIYKNSIEVRQIEFVVRCRSVLVTSSRPSVKNLH